MESPGGIATGEIMINTRNIVEPWSESLQGALEQPGNPDIIATLDAFAGLVRMEPQSLSGSAFLQILMEGRPCTSGGDHMHALVTQGVRHTKMEESAIRDLLGPAAEGLEIPDGAIPGILSLDAICSLGAWPLICAIASQQGILLLATKNSPADHNPHQG